MNTTLLLISIVGSVVLVVLTLLFVAGFLLRCDMARLSEAGFSAPQFTRDPLDLKDLLVQFFARSKGSSRIIPLLAARHKPVGYQALIDDFRFDEKWRRDSDEMPANAIPAVLGIMRVAGLVRITRRGLSLTEVGREVHRRIEPSAPVQRPQPPAIRTISGNAHRASMPLSSADRTVLRELRTKSRILVHE
ncbi:MAG: hypothetical protein ABI680_03400 [Chthoniobacteraceae bacterium]